MARIRRGFVHTSHGDILVRYGGRGPNVVVLHHTYGSSESGMRGDFLPRLADSAFVIAPDTLGQGESATPVGQSSVEEYAENIVDVLRELGVGRASFVGHHTGATIALHIAVTHPAMVEKLIFSGLPVWTAEERDRRLANAKYVPWEPNADGSYLDALWKSRLVIAHGLTPLETHRQFMEYLRAGPRVSEPLRALFAYDALARFPKVQVPTLALTALSDGFGDRLDEIVSRVPGCERAIVADGTLFHNLDADAFLATVVDFLDLD